MSATPQSPVAFTESQSRMLEVVRSGLDPNQAARIAGVSLETLRQWELVAEGAGSWPGTNAPVRQEKRNQIVAFLAALAQAKQQGFYELVQRLQHNATTPNEKTGWYDTQAIDKLLSKSAFRDGWYEQRKVEIDHTGSVIHELKLAQQLEPQALEAAYEALHALPAETQSE